MYLTKRDKELIKLIEKNDHLGNMIDSWLSNYTIDIDLEHTKCILNLHGSDYNSHPENYQNPMKDYFNPLISKLWDLVTLLEKLEKAGLIRFVDNSNVAKKKMTLGAGCINENAISCDLPDENFNRLLTKYGTKWFTKLPEFDQFIKRNYKLHEDWKWAWQIKIALLALIATATGVFINLYFNFNKATSEVKQVLIMQAMSQHADDIRSQVTLLASNLDSLKQTINKNPAQKDSAASRGNIPKACD